jgi:uncharacterized protein (TIGR01777 family)
MRIGVTGSHGLIGQALALSLVSDGHEAISLPRLAADPSLLDGLDAVVHLAGAPIAAGRWTAARKAVIRESRIQGTRALVEAISQGTRPPQVLLGGSAVGYYGDRGNEVLDEESAPGVGFLAKVCQAWEQEARQASSFGLRVVLLRTGVVLSREGGALPRLLRPFRLFCGGPLGNGAQWVSWIHISDLVGAIRFALEDDSLAGPLNLTAPAPVTSRELARQIGRALRRPARLAAPAIALRLLSGQMAQELLLNGQRVFPSRLLAAGFRFRFGELADALRDLV